MVINEKIKAMADKYIDYTYQNADIATFENLPETDQQLKAITECLKANMDDETFMTIEDDFVSCLLRYQEQGIYYGLLHAAEILKAAKELQEATR